MTSRDDLFLLHELDDDEIDTLRPRTGERRTEGEKEASSTPSTVGGEQALGRPAAPRSAPPLAGWRILATFWAALIAVACIAAIGLQIAGPRQPRPGKASVAAETTSRSVPPAPPSSPGPDARGAPPLHLQAMMTASGGPEPLPPPAVEPPPAASQNRPPVPESETPSAPPAPDLSLSAPQEARLEAPAPQPPRSARKRPAASDDLQPDRTPSAATASAQGAPSLLIHYPSGSVLALTDAQRLAAQAEASPQTSVIADQTGAPAAATIKYYDAKDHASAQAMGKSLQKLGYKWRIEKGSSTAGQPQAALEVFMPTK